MSGTTKKHSYISLSWQHIFMSIDFSIETKRSFSDKIVRHYPLHLSVKTSDILRHISHPLSTNGIYGDWSDGIVYFSGNASFKSHHINEVYSDAQTNHTNEIIAFFPKVLLIAHTESDEIRITRLERTTNNQYTRSIRHATTTEYFAELRALSGENTPKDKQNKSDKSSSFKGGLAGFIGYDIAAHQQIAVPINHQTQTERLIAAFGDYDIFLKKEEQGWALYGSDNPTLAPLLQHIIATIQAIEATPPKITDKKLPDKFTVTKPFSPKWSFDEYAFAFKRIQHYLRAGDCYQVNLTQPFIATVQGYLVEILDHLLELTQAPYSGYMRVGEHELLSCSPELFLSFSGVDPTGHNHVITRPIKGTRPRVDDKVHDAIEREALIHSEKDHSENLMIVDLLRNDLSRHAIVGSVEVPALFELESFAQVHHLVSEVRATLRPDVSALDVLIDALPGGSITGAPKKRAMEIIAELEAMPRGAYCGSFGYLNRDGSGQFNVLIRTLQKYQNELVAWAGGGITIASDVHAEYQECLDKISAILDCVNGFGSEKDH